MHAWLSKCIQIAFCITHLITIKKCNPKTHFLWKGNENISLKKKAFQVETIKEVLKKSSLKRLAIARATRGKPLSCI